MVTGNQQRLEFNLRNLAIQMQQAKEKGTTYPLPRLEELLQLAEFSTLRRWLAEWGVEVGELQGIIDERVREIDESRLSTTNLEINESVKGKTGFIRSFLNGLYSYLRWW
jgi:hypothetical protein